MNTTLWLFLIVAIFAILAFISYMVRLLKKSRQIEKNLDYSKMREWKDDD